MVVVALCKLLGEPGAGVIGREVVDIFKLESVSKRVRRDYGRGLYYRGLVVGECGGSAEVPACRMEDMKVEE